MREKETVPKCISDRSANATGPQGDAELVYGAFRNKLPPRVRDRVYAATKWCVFGPVAQPITEEYVLDAVRERCRRLGGRVELLQFHWYDVGTGS